MIRVALTLLLCLAPLGLATAQAAPAVEDQVAALESRLAEVEEQLRLATEAAEGLDRIEAQFDRLDGRSRPQALTAFGIAAIFAVASVGAYQLGRRRSQNSV